MECCSTKAPWYKKLSTTLLGTGNCHGDVNQVTQGLEKIALVGSPNVGSEGSEIHNLRVYDYYYYYNQSGTAWFDAMRLENGASNTFNTYDANGNYVTSVKDPLGNTVSSTYDAVGNTTSLKDGKNQTTSFEYDGINRLTEVTDAKLGITAYGYDGAGNRTTVTDAKNNTSSYGYNEFNQVSSYTNPSVSGGTNSVALKIRPNFQLLKIRANLTFLYKSFTCNILDVFILFLNQPLELGIR